MKHKKYTADLSGWNLDAVEEITGKINASIYKAAAEALQYIFDGHQTYIYFPVEWSKEPYEAMPGTDGIGGPEVADPLTVYLRVGMGSEDAEPTYEFNLREALADSIELCAEDGSFSAGLGRLSVALRALADEIDTARQKSNDQVQP